MIIPDTDDAATAADGILKDYYAASTGTQKTNTISMTEAVTAALKDSEDGIVTFMVYSAGSGNDVYSVNGAPSLASRPSLTIVEEDSENKSYEISFDASKNPKGELSVTVDGINYTDGTAYAKEGGTVTINNGANTGYTANITVKKIRWQRDRSNRQQLRNACREGKHIGGICKADLRNKPYCCAKQRVDQR